MVSVSRGMCHRVVGFETPRTASAVRRSRVPKRSNGLKIFTSVQSGPLGVCSLSRDAWRGGVVSHSTCRAIAYRCMEVLEGWGELHSLRGCWKLEEEGEG